MRDSMSPFRPVEVREIVNRTFSNLTKANDHCRETLLIRGGFYCGYRYCVGELSAIWFIEEEQIKFYDSRGRTIQVVCPGAGGQEVAA